MKHPDNKYTEKRQHPRVNTNIRFKLKAGEMILGAEAVNLSANGVYCKTSKPVPLMTSLNIVLTLLHEDLPEEAGYVECGGVVVRSEKAPSGYYIAIFFNEIDAGEKKKLDHFIHQCLALKKEPLAV